MKKDIVDLTIVTVTFNNIDGLRKTLDSIHKLGSLLNVEVIVVDGGSKDGSVELIKSSSIITKYVSENDNGIYDAMNKGIILASGNYINFMNAGDIFHPSFRLEHIYNEIFSGDSDVFYGKSRRISGDKEFDFNTLPLDSILFEMPFCHQSIFTKRTLFERPYSLDYKIAGDYEFYLNLFILGRKFNFINNYISVVDNDGLSNVNKFSSTLERFNILKEHKLVNSKTYIKFMNYFLRSLVSDSLRKLHSIGHN